MKIGGRAAWVAGVLAALSGCAVAPPADLTASVELRPYVGRLNTIDVTLAGEPLRMLFDTGAGLTAVNPDVAARLGCVASGRTVGWRMSGERVDFPLCRGAELGVGAGRLSLPLYGIFDLGHVLPKELPKVDGIVGLDAFIESTLTLQLGARILQVDRGTSGKALDASWSSVPMRLATGVDGATVVVFLGVSAPNGSTVWLELDSGNLDVILLAPHAARALGADPSATDARLPLALGSLVTEALPVMSRELLHDGALNADFLERYDLRLDLRERRAWLRQRRN